MCRFRTGFCRLCCTLCRFGGSGGLARVGFVFLGGNGTAGGIIAGSFSLVLGIYSAVPQCLHLGKGLGILAGCGGAVGTGQLRVIQHHVGQIAADALHTVLHAPEGDGCVLGCSHTGFWRDGHKAVRVYQDGHALIVGRVVESCINRKPAPRIVKGHMQLLDTVTVKSAKR